MDCSQEVIGFSFTFGGVEIPIHPLDVTAPLAFLGGDKSVKGCLGLWQTIGEAGSGNLPEGFDLLLGMAFREFIAICDLRLQLTRLLYAVRNVYMVVNVGDFVEGFTNQTADPYIQLLPLTNDTTRVHTEFVNARKGSGAVGASMSMRKASVVLMAGIVVYGMLA
jgi:hypothetical protein